MIQLFKHFDCLPAWEISLHIVQSPKLLAVHSAQSLFFLLQFKFECHRNLYSTFLVNIMRCGQKARKERRERERKRKIVTHKASNVPRRISSHFSLTLYMDLFNNISIYIPFDKWSVHRKWQQFSIVCLCMCT